MRFHVSSAILCRIRLGEKRTGKEWEKGGIREKEEKNLMLRGM